MKQKITFLIIGISAFILSCKKNDLTNTTPVTPVTTDSLIAPASFNFNTTKNVIVSINLAAGDNAPIGGVPVDIYTGDPATTSPVATVVTNASGALNATLNVPAHVDTLVIDAKYIGLMRNAKAVISNGAVSGTIGGAAGYSGSFVESSYTERVPKGMRALNSFNPLASAGNATYTYMGPYDSSGVPKDLVPASDVITADLLTFLNASLPETVDVRKIHPQYLQSSATADLNIVKDGDVWITFVSEGAGYLNSLGYYTYPTNSPPKSAADIKVVTYIFPNASLPGSGGNLRPGNKIKLGKFSAGTSIGFVLFANAWNGKEVNSDATKFYSTTACNPETKAELKKHTVLLYAEKQKLYMIGFDDQNRESGSDNDFNDVVFYATSNPPAAISNENVQPVDQPKDTDGDGVTDTFDQYPNDPTRAYVSYYPSKTTFGTLLFEDLWPATGDYDLNDLVIGYRYKTVTNAQNLAVEMYADYAVEASGASYVSGFGIQFPFSPGQVKTVSGQKLIGNYTTQSGNGTEAGQSKAVIIPFDNYQAIIKRPGGYYINTQIGAPYIMSDTVHIYMGFTTPLSASTLGTAPFNPFLISNQRRGYEVHLPNTLPTDLADKRLFGTLQDNTNTGLGIYYKTQKGWPSALNFAAPFDYSAEGVSIAKSYNYFLQWAKSGGTLHQDWYLNTAGNRNESMIYKK
ncbi:LruC domain-containing protein [Mucilaginibacter sp.]|uniref:LruC domain-containing protein n=1 Tax=Mucilaginibacter sp. TaxID=1882438 RepID=UPI0025DAD12F|nr:LruC domain-containing protein [Mucilaginibacter sp.]